MLWHSQIKVSSQFHCLSNTLEHLHVPPPPQMIHKAARASQTIHLRLFCRIKIWLLIDKEIWGLWSGEAPPEKESLPWKGKTHQLKITWGTKPMQHPHPTTKPQPLWTNNCRVGANSKVSALLKPFSAGGKVCLLRDLLPRGLLWPCRAGGTTRILLCYWVVAHPAPLAQFDPL